MTRDRTRLQEFLKCFLLVLVTLGAYSNAYRGPFLFDDLNGITTDLSIRSFPACLLFSTRPLTKFTFYLNYISSGLAATSFHIVNVVIHTAAALLFYGLMKKLLESAKWTSRIATAGTAAFAIAAIWAAHPLQTESVTYVSQRAESLMSMLYIATLFTFLVAQNSKRPAIWYAGSVLCCAAGMASKPVMITAPIVLLLVDRLFVSSSLRDAFRKKPFYYALIAATWLIPATVLSLPNESSATAGQTAQIWSTGEYAATQPGVILYYLKTAIWPQHLTIGYHWPLAEGVSDYAIPAAVLASLLIVSILLARRDPTWGFGGLLFFITIAPSSSIIPLADFLAEHRMYLPLGGLVMLVVVTVIRATERIPAARLQAVRATLPFLLAVTVLALVARTYARNNDYLSEEAMWRSAIETAPVGPGAKINFARGLIASGKFDVAEKVALEVLQELEQCSRMTREQLLARRSGKHGFRAEGEAVNYAKAHDHLGIISMKRREFDQAREHFNEALRLFPDFRKTRHNLALTLVHEGRALEAAAAWEAIVEGSPHDSKALSWTGLFAITAGDDRKAADRFRDVIVIEQVNPYITFMLAWLLATSADDSVRDGEEAVTLARELCKLTAYTDPAALDLLAAAQAEAGEYEAATAAAGKAISLAMQYNMPPEYVQELAVRAKIYEQKKPVRNERPAVTMDELKALL